MRFWVRSARFLWVIAVTALAACAATTVRPRLYVPAQSEDTKELVAGEILVARRELQDPNFAATVVLLVQYDEEGTVGLIINRQSKVPVSKLSPELAAAKGRAEPLYLGGPVETGAVMALLRTRTKPEEAKRVSAEVYLISGKAALEKTMNSTTSANALRVYLGYAGWANGQLEWELGMDAWTVLPANAGIVFDPHPETLWSRLIQDEDLQKAGTRDSIPLALRSGIRPLDRPLSALAPLWEATLAVNLSRLQLFSPWPTRWRPSLLWPRGI